MSELIPANIVIADRTYRLKIEAEDEEVVRKTSKIINEKIQEFRNEFAGKDMQDYVSMVLLWFATEQNKAGAEMIKLKETAEKLTAFENYLDKAIAETK
ncbi:MAG: cell division protein ZapA [Chitinophagaceae bacterium]|nr:cell division protein ZapA [Chitinophagaceae bacterium]